MRSNEDERDRVVPRAKKNLDRQEVVPMQDIILKRRSIRKYTEEPVSEEAIRLLL